MIKLAWEAIALLRCIAWDVRVIRQAIESQTDHDSAESLWRSNASAMLKRCKGQSDRNTED